VIITGWFGYLARTGAFLEIHNPLEASNLLSSRAMLTKFSIANLIAFVAILINKISSLLLLFIQMLYYLQ
jgi:hypothetical protein